MTDTQKPEPREMDGPEFIQVAEIIRERIKTAADLKPEGRSISLEVLAAIVRSVKVHGVRQHGLTKKKKQIALAVFEKMLKDEVNTAEEKAVLETLVVVTFQGIVNVR